MRCACSRKNNHVDLQVCRLHNKQHSLLYKNDLIQRFSYSGVVVSESDAKLHLKLSRSGGAVFEKNIYTMLAIIM